MPKAPAAITSPKLKKIAQKAVKSPSMLSTAETRELGASIMAFLTPSTEGSPVPVKKSAAKKSPAKEAPAKRP